MYRILHNITLHACSTSRKKNVCIHQYTDIRTHVYQCMCVRTLTCTHMHENYIDQYTDTHTHTYQYMCIRTHTYQCMCIRTHEYQYMCIRTHIYQYTDIRSLKYAHMHETSKHARTTHMLTHPLVLSLYSSLGYAHTLSKPTHLPYQPPTTETGTNEGKNAPSRVQWHRQRHSPTLLAPPPSTPSYTHSNSDHFQEFGWVREGGG